MIKTMFYKNAKFPDGTPKIDYVPYPIFDDKIEPHVILWAYDGMDELFNVYSIGKHMIKKFGKAILVMPYVPNARMDRVQMERDVFTLKYFADIINQVGFREIRVLDPHSDVCMGMINNSKAMGSALCDNIMAAFTASNPDVVYFPDAGALKRYSGILHNSLVGNKIAKKKIVFGNKDRDWQTGEIKNMQIVGSISDGDKVLIIDDICSFGGTFKRSAEALKKLGASDISMYVSHSENSILEGGLLDETDLIKKVYTTDSIFTGTHEKVELISSYRQ